MIGRKTQRRAKMGRENVSFARSIQGHTVILGRIYAFLGWLGLGGAALLLFQMSVIDGSMAPGMEAQQSILSLSPPVGLFLLVVWSLLLINFSKDICGKRIWSTGICGVLVGCFSLLSVPVGTAVGTYTLWVLFHLHRMS